MAISDEVKTGVRTFIKKQLDALAASKGWPIPDLATDVKLDDDTYLAVREYAEDAGDPDRGSSDAGPARWDLVAHTVPLQRVVHSAVLNKAEVDQFKVEAEPNGPDWPDSPRGRMGALATEARLTQVDDLLRGLVENQRIPTNPVPLTPTRLTRTIEAMRSDGRLVLVHPRETQQVGRQGDRGSRRADRPPPPSRRGADEPSSRRAGDGVPDRW